ncbi:hypothetical protein [Armatimonas sp.]|uniref:hypothetical protein n=1 Tax=Armatimonas sp. TaxID=1872638 RepID=UPI0037522AD7
MARQLPTRARQIPTRDPDVLRARAENEAGPPQGYVAVAWYPWGKTSASLLAVSGKIVLFDTKQIAREFLPILGQGRASSWSADGETLVFTPVDPKGINRCALVTQYDPYDLPAQMPNAIRSETRLMPWRSHIMFTHAFLDCGQHEMKDGKVTNPLLPEHLQTPGEAPPAYSLVTPADSAR